MLLSISSVSTLPSLVRSHRYRFAQPKFLNTQQRRTMGRLSFECQTMTFQEAFHRFKAKEYDLQKQLVDAVLLSNFKLADKIKMELHTIAPPCDDDVRLLLEKGRGNFIGQCFFHKKNGYRGVIFKPDYRCRMDETWIQMMGVRCLERGPDQPFYHCLVDERDRPGAQTTYVAEDNVHPSTEAFSIQHPLLSSLFTAVPELQCYIGTESLEYILSDYDD